MKYCDLKYFISEDARVAGIKSDLKHKLWYLLFPVYSFKYIKLVRKATFFCESENIFLRFWGIILSIIVHRRSKSLGFFIPKANFGKGLYIPHSGSVIINPNAKIGNYCHVNSNVVIGKTSNGVPTIGNNVFIGAGAVICGDVFIADNVWVGANSVVTKDITEPNVLVAGNPAKIVRKKNENWVSIYL